MKRSIIILLALLIIGVTGAMAQPTEQDMDEQYATELVKVGTIAPDFKMKTPDGKTIQLSEFGKGKTVVLDFWASWCPDCRKEAPEVTRMYESYHPYGIEFIGISMDTDVEAWKAAIEKYGIAYPQVSEMKKFKETEIAKAYGVKWIPSMVVVGPDGQVKLSTVMTYKVDKYLKKLTGSFYKSTEVRKAFRTVKENPITSVKNQYRSGTCWDFATLGFFESEILRETGKIYDLCEMFVVNKDYMDCATHYVRMHGYSQISEGGSCDDVLEVIRQHGICPEGAMPAPGSLTGDSLANFSVFFPELERTVSGIVRKDEKEPLPHWQDSVQAVIERYVGCCPESFVYEGKTYTPKSFAESLGLDLDDYVSLTSYTHHPFNKWFVIEAPYKWRLKPSYNIPIEQLMDILDKALDAGYTVAWGGDVSGDFTHTGLAMLPEGVTPTQQMRQEQWNNWRFTYDHVMLIYGKALDEEGKPYYMVKNSWGAVGPYKGIWYMSRDYMTLNTTYLFLNRQALPKSFCQTIAESGF